jgi:hypothetical protein
MERDRPATPGNGSDEARSSVAQGVRPRLVAQPDPEAGVPDLRQVREAVDRLVAVLDAVPVRVLLPLEEPALDPLRVRRIGDPCAGGHPEQVARAVPLRDQPVVIEPFVPAEGRLSERAEPTVGHPPQLGSAVEEDLRVRFVLRRHAVIEAPIDLAKRQAPTQAEGPVRLAMRVLELERGPEAGDALGQLERHRKRALATVEVE